jgi:hypothetical protein
MLGTASTLNVWAETKKIINYSLLKLKLWQQINSK